MEGNLEGGGIFLDGVRGGFNSGDAEINVEDLSQAAAEEAMPVPRGEDSLAGLRQALTDGEGSPGFCFDEGDQGTYRDGKQGQIPGRFSLRLRKRGVIGKGVLLDVHGSRLRDGSMIGGLTPLKSQADGGYQAKWEVDLTEGNPEMCESDTFPFPDKDT